MKCFSERIADNIKFEMKYSGKTRKEIAWEIGISPKTLSHHCSGQRQPSLETLAKLCEVLDVSADDILEVGKK